MAIGAFTKSAQYPFHSWLPAAMAAPTPVSAYLHSATMVKAGVYLLGRFAPVFALTSPWRPLVLTVGLVTMIAGGLRALRQYDLKLLLAYGTVSQLGFLVVLFGAGTTAATQAGIVLLIAHALFKAMAFMVVGIVDHQTGTRDIRLLPAAARRLDVDDESSPPSARRRWPACRCSSASSPRSRRTPRSPTARSAAAGSSSPASSSGRR